jgi:hypothetical protein
MKNKEVTLLQSQKAEAQNSLHQVIRNKGSAEQITALRAEVEAVTKRAKERGFDLWEDESVREGSKGLAASMTQDQATEMNGFLNNGLIFWWDIAHNTGLIVANLTDRHPNTVDGI